MDVDKVLNDIPNVFCPTSFHSNGRSVGAKFGGDESTSNESFVRSNVNFTISSNSGDISLISSYNNWKDPSNNGVEFDTGVGGGDERVIRTHDLSIHTRKNPT